MPQLGDEHIEAAATIAAGEAYAARAGNGWRSSQRRRQFAMHSASRAAMMINTGAINRGTSVDQAVGMIGFSWLASMLFGSLIRFIVQKVLDYYWESQFPEKGF